MISITELNKAWDGISPQRGQTIGRRADPTHPLDFFITYDENHNMQLMLLSDYQPALPSSSQQIAVRGNQRADGKYAVCFALSDAKLRDQYVSLCWDIMNCTYDTHDKKSGTKAVIKRFSMWQRLFAEARTKKLSDAEIKGLIGELAVLTNICIPQYGSEAAVAGWIGPIGADRDFEFFDCWYESKFVSLSKDSVDISSFDQLDSDNPGYLMICRIEKTAPDAPNAFTLNALVDDAFKLIAGDDNAEASLKNKLSLYGYDCTDDRADKPYLLHKIEKYAVGAEFPRIRRSVIHTAVSDGDYTLSIPALQPWRMDNAV